MEMASKEAKPTARPKARVYRHLYIPYGSTRTADGTAHGLILHTCSDNEYALALRDLVREAEHEDMNATGDVVAVIFAQLPYMEDWRNVKQLEYPEIHAFFTKWSQQPRPIVDDFLCNMEDDMDYVLNNVTIDSTTCYFYNVHNVF